MMLLMGMLYDEWGRGVGRKGQSLLSEYAHQKMVSWGRERKMVLS
jgi:hypothetical protein